MENEVKTEVTVDTERLAAKERATVYYSEKLNKYFTKYEDLEAAEDEVRKAEEAKKLAAESRKADATKVEEAYKAVNEAKKMFNERVDSAKKVYLEEVAAIKEKYEKTVESAERAVEEAEEIYNTALKEFTAKHPEGYHTTLKDGDNRTTIYRSAGFDDGWSDFFDSLGRLFRF